MRRTLGGTLDPHAAFLVLRGIKTLSLRMRAHNANAVGARGVPERSCEDRTGELPRPEGSPAVRRCQEADGRVWRDAQLRGQGYRGGAVKLTESLKLATLGASLGGVETLVSQPATLTHTQLSADDAKRTGISEL